MSTRQYTRLSLALVHAVSSIGTLALANTLLEMERPIFLAPGWLLHLIADLLQYPLARPIGSDILGITMDGSAAGAWASYTLIGLNSLLWIYVLFPLVRRYSTATEAAEIRR